MTYSVSPTVRPISRGPKPIENFSTPTPTRLATRKWPISWNRIEKAEDDDGGDERW